ncbi:copper resistance protein [Bacillus methanolicus]|uniref:copper resistance protein CopC n=1 Tax=Bacillus methanolicus TaxID=1471 RepID=UPI00201087C4|nr:copper resistance protein CopC [Bacillus methanolicus]UQD50960.1 copper resistance protein [Bacillus methanolicus]
MGSFRKLGLWAFIIFLVIALFPVITYAHAYIVKSSPMENQTLSKPPSVVSIQFNEFIQPDFYSLSVMDASGKRVDLKNAHINKQNHAILEAGIKKNLPNGTYSMQWKIISSDGHPVQGVIPFRIGHAGKEANALQGKTSSYLPKVDILINRWLLYMGIALYLGVIFFHLFIYRAEHQESSKVQSKSKKIIWLSLLGIAISLLLNLPLQTSINADVTWSQAFTPSLLKETLNHTSFGLIWVVQMMIFGILVITTYFAIKRGSLSSMKAWGASLIFIMGLLITKSLTSHASGHQHEIIPVALDFLHLLAASVWIGILSAIAIILPRSHPETENGHQSRLLYWRVIQRFSPWAIGAVIIIFATGMYGSFMYVPTFYSLIHTSYGRVLLGKIILFFFMFLLGAYHFNQGKKRVRQKLGWTLRLELAIGVIVILMAAILTNLPPATASPGPFDQTKRVADNGYHVSLHISPNIEGVNVFKVKLKDKRGRAPTNIEQVTLTFSSTKQAGESTVIVPNAAPGVFQTEGMHLNMAGYWNVRVHVLTKSLDSFDTDFPVVVGSQ